MVRFSSLSSSLSVIVDSCPPPRHLFSYRVVPWRLFVIVGGGPVFGLPCRRSTISNINVVAAKIGRDNLSAKSHDTENLRKLDFVSLSVARAWQPIGRTSNSNPSTLYNYSIRNVIRARPKIDVLSSRPSRHQGTAIILNHWCRNIVLIIPASGKRPHQEKRDSLI